jgi:hypothetical protein
MYKPVRQSAPVTWFGAWITRTIPVAWGSMREIGSLDVQGKRQHHTLPVVHNYAPSIVLPSEDIVETSIHMCVRASVHSSIWLSIMKAYKFDLLA